MGITPYISSDFDPFHPFFYFFGQKRHVWQNHLGSAQKPRLAADEPNALNPPDAGTPEREAVWEKDWMLIRTVTAAVLLAALWPSLSIAASEIIASEVMERVDARDRGRSETSALEMILVSRGGEKRPRQLKSWRLDGSETRHTLLRFVAPADLRATALLTHDHIGPDYDDDQWIYLPALQSLKRVAQADQRTSFMGSDFSYADLTRQERSRYTYRFVGGDGADGSWSIEALPDAKELARTGYRRSVLEVRKDNFVVVTAHHEIADSSRVKKFEVNRLEQIDGIWVALETEMSTWEQDTVLHRTRMRLSNLRLNTAVDEGMFRPNRIARGR